MSVRLDRHYSALQPPFTLSPRIMTLHFSLTPELDPNEAVRHPVYYLCSVKLRSVSSFMLSAVITSLDFSLTGLFAQVFRL